MDEINIRYLQDSDGERYLPMTHIDCVIGLEELQSNWDNSNSNNQTELNTLKVRINTLETSTQTEIGNIQSSINSIDENYQNINTLLNSVNETLTTITNDITQMKLDIEVLQNNDTEPPGVIEQPTEKEINETGGNIENDTP